MSILARVATCLHSKIILGPVDLTYSFVVVDVRRFDRPIIYASFYQLTGYEDHEVIGRNYRFLQPPDGNVHKGEERRYVAPETVQYLYKVVVSDKECQASIINYRKGGQAFINLVTIIPIAGGVHNTPEESDEVVYRAGAPAVPSLPAPPPCERRATSSIISNNLQALLSGPTLVNSLPISTSTTAPTSENTREKPFA